MDLVERPAGQLPDSRRHPWEVARVRIFLRLIERLDLVGTTKSWLDVGAGDAWFARQLSPMLPADARIVCWDPNYQDSDLSAQSSPRPDGYRDVELTAKRPDGTFEGILLLDVIEHVEDDVTFIRDVVQDLLTPSGWVLVSVPAYKSLFSDHDRALKHYRRYSPQGLRVLLESAGLVVRARGGLFRGLLPFRGVQVVRERFGRSKVQKGVGDWRSDERMSRAMTRVLEAEGRISMALGIPHMPVLAGLSTWAYCRRAEDVRS